MVAKVKVGDTLRDNDKRTNGRTVVVTDINVDVPGEEYAIYHTGKRKAKIMFRRIHTDGKTRGRGFNLVRDAAR